MAQSVKLAQWRLDLDAICGPVARQPRKLTGIERQALEIDPLEAIADEYHKEFGR
jgi:hypothetical protein